MGAKPSENQFHEAARPRAGMSAPNTTATFTTANPVALMTTTTIAATTAATPLTAPLSPFCGESAESIVSRLARKVLSSYSTAFSSINPSGRASAREAMVRHTMEKIEEAERKKRKNIKNAKAARARRSKDREGKKLDKKPSSREKGGTKEKVGRQQGAQRQVF